MKIKELMKKLAKFPETLDIVVGLNESDIEEINKLAEKEPAVLLLNIDIMSESIDNNLVIYTYPSKHEIRRDMV